MVSQLMFNKNVKIFEEIRNIHVVACHMFPWYTTRSDFLLRQGIARALRCSCLQEYLCSVDLQGSRTLEQN